MSFSKTWCFALLLAVMFAPACVPKSGGQELVQDTPAEEEKPKSAGVQKQSIKIGETVTFGQYPQAIETPEPIEWIVLDIDSSEDKVLLLSKYVLDARPYDTNRTNTWDKCSLRNWLNHEFLDIGFSSSEQDAILTTHIKNPDIFMGPKGGDDTDDKVFLLSPKEVKHYFRNDAEREAKATTYAIHNGPVVNAGYGVASSFHTCKSDANVQCSSVWWLRAPGTSPMTEGSSPYRAARIYIDGNIGSSGGSVRDDKGVRPALWVSASALAKKTPKPAAVPAVEPPEPAPAVPVAADGKCDGAVFQGLCAVKGSTVTFGQTSQATDAREPIEWIVLDIDSANGKMLLLSKYVLDVQKYNDSHDNSVNYHCAVIPITWEECTLRSWLNHEFLNSVFSSSEQTSILTTHLENSDNPYGASGGNATDDKVFLLSIAEVNQYFRNDAERKAKATMRVIRSDQAWVKGYLNNAQSMVDTCANAQCEAKWWLRSPGYNGFSAANVRVDGDVDIYGKNVCISDMFYYTYIGVRPAIWVNYAAAPEAAAPAVKSSR